MRADVPVHEFFFAVDASEAALSGPPGREADDLLRDLTVQVLAHAGIAVDAEPVVEAVRDAVQRLMREDGNGGPAPCRVQFSVEDKLLTILVSSPAGRTWRQTHPAP
jgi:hypothetical protein